MNNKDKYTLFQQYLEEEIRIKKTLEDKSNVVTTLLIVLITGLFLNLKDIFDLINHDIKIPVLVLLLSQLLIISYCLFCSLKVFSNKAYKKTIPKEYYQLFFETDKPIDDNTFFDQLLYDMNTKVEINSALNVIKSKWVKRAQVSLAISYLLVFLMITIILINHE